MKKLKAYSLMEMLVVMTILIIVLSVGVYAYVAYIETTKYNQDVANLQNDIRSIQRASMLFKKDANDGWVYGVGIDFQGVIDGNGTYQFFKWCSGFDEYGQDPRTTGKYPNYNSATEDSWGIPVATPEPFDTSFPDCPSINNDVTGSLNNGGVVSLSGYGSGKLNLEEDVVMAKVNPEADDSPVVRFLLFESVTGRAFFFDEIGNRLTNDTAKIYFDKRIGTKNVLKIDALTGKGTVMGMSDAEIEEMEDIIDDREPLPPSEPEPDEPEPEPDEPEPEPDDPDPDPGPEPEPDDPEPYPYEPGPFYPYPGEGECVKPGDCYYIDDPIPPTYDY